MTLLHPGDVVDGYEVVSILGKGGMGAVYRVRRGSVFYALKTQLVLGNSPDVIVRFQREAELLASLNHEHLVRVHAAGRVGSATYFVMSLIEGESLEEVIRRGPLPEEAALAILIPIAEAVAYAHERKIIHRDLKPANVLIEKETGRPFLTDFGLARQTDERDRLTRTGEILGTPSYLSPEQALGVKEELDEKTDVYGLAATLYAVLAGGPPFTGPTAVAIMRNVCCDEAPPIPGISPGLQAVIQRALAKKREHRPPTVEALLRQLDEAIAVNAGPPDRLRQVAGYAFVGALLSLGLLGGLVVGRKLRNPTPPAGPGTESPDAASTASSTTPRPGTRDPCAPLAGALELAVAERLDEARAALQKVVADASASDATAWLAREGDRWVQRRDPAHALAAFALALEATPAPPLELVRRALPALELASVPARAGPVGTIVRTRLFEAALNARQPREQLERLEALSLYSPPDPLRERVGRVWVAEARKAAKLMSDAVGSDARASAREQLREHLGSLVRSLRRATRAWPEVGAIPDEVSEALEQLMSVGSQFIPAWDQVFVGDWRPDAYGQHPLVWCQLALYSASNVATVPELTEEMIAKDLPRLSQRGHLPERLEGALSAFQTECPAHNKGARLVAKSLLVMISERLVDPRPERWPNESHRSVVAASAIAVYADCTEGWEATAKISTALGDQTAANTALERARSSRPLSTEK